MAAKQEYFPLYLHTFKFVLYQEGASGEVEARGDLHWCNLALAPREEATDTLFQQKGLLILKRLPVYKTKLNNCSLN